MDVVGGLLIVVITIAFVIGLIKPNIILRKAKKPTRLKVFLFWIIGVILLGLMIQLFTTKEMDYKNSFERAERLIESGEYDYAILELDKINQDSELFYDARDLIDKADSLKTVEREEKEKADKLEVQLALKNRLEQYLKDIDEIDFPTYRTALGDMNRIILYFEDFGVAILQGIASEDTQTIKLANQLKAKTSKIQIREFPHLRKGLAKELGKKLWEEDITVTTSSSGNSIITFTGAIFAANKNKKSAQTEISDLLRKYRFKQSRYQWIKSASEYTYYEIFDGTDGDIIGI